MAELIAALDFDLIEDAEKFCKNTSGSLSWVKIGSVMFTKYGPQAVKTVKSYGFKVFLDLKFHDIPNTVAAAVRNALLIGADMVNIHAGGGEEMIKAAVNAAKTTNPDALLIAVTVLTSFDEESFRKAYGKDDSAKIADHVLMLAKFAERCGADGIVCSSHELEMIRKSCSEKFLTVVPGIRPSWENTGDDQKRVMTPATAVKAGADFIVVGRPIIKAQDPAEAALKIKEEMS